MAHRCLGIPEVLLIVARELREESLASVLNLAPTHSSMCGPCLEVLWEKQTTLVPVLKLFPECEIRDCPGMSDAQDLVSALVCWAQRMLKARAKARCFA